MSVNLQGEGWSAYLLIIMVWIVNLLLIFIVKSMVEFFYYERYYSEIKKIKCKVSHKRTDFYLSGGKIPISHYFIVFKGEDFEEEVDSEQWYDNFNLLDNVLVYYNEVYRRRRFSDNTWERIGNNIEMVTKE